MFLIRADAIVCLDACFTQKRRSSPRGGNSRGPSYGHPDTVFLSEQEIAAMKAAVEEVQPDNSQKKTETSDTYESFMKVPTSALDACLESFTAADEKRIKASTKLFSDTGLMALLCRHDRVLWLANMTTAGEQQYYALALIQRLFENIPLTMTIGILYDIGCQLDRSCEKWDFLQLYRDRIIFGISVFHAYGHQWACQLIYHPRKCRGFGLSDGEGCERFWSSIKLLIPSLRVSGYYRRLYSLDSQVKFLEHKSLISLGKWLYRKSAHCQIRKEKALAILDSINISHDVLRQEWKAQVTEQTKPLPSELNFEFCCFL